MADQIVNYDGSITTNPRKLVYPENVDTIREVLRNSNEYPSPVRAMGSYHSLTPCASADYGTILNMSRMNRVIAIDPKNETLTAEAGLQVIEASRALRRHDLQLMTNIEIGNLTLGAGACCHSKDALDGIPFGQVCSYVTKIKWVKPNGDLAEVSESNNPELLHKMRSSHGLCGVIYEVTYRIKRIEAIQLTYEPRLVDALTEDEVDKLMTEPVGLICWTVGRTAVFQRRVRISQPAVFGSLEAALRRRLWSHTEAHAGHFIGQFIPTKFLRAAFQQVVFGGTRALYSMLWLMGGITMLGPDKIVDYRSTPPSAKYAFTFWAFPRSKWLFTLRAYLDFADRYYNDTGFRCNMPLGAYHIRRDRNSILSYSYDEDMFSIDPIHASTDSPAWHKFLRAFNDFASMHKGIPLLNQSPFVERKHLESAFGRRWFEFSKWVAEEDPTRRMLNPFFADLLSLEAA